MLRPMLRISHRSSNSIHNYYKKQFSSRILSLNNNNSNNNTNNNIDNFGKHHVLRQHQSIFQCNNKNQFSSSHRCLQQHKKKSKSKSATPFESKRKQTFLKPTEFNDLLKTPEDSPLRKGMTVIQLFHLVSNVQWQKERLVFELEPLRILVNELAKRNMQEELVSCLCGQLYDGRDEKVEIPVELLKPHTATLNEQDFVLEMRRKGQFGNEDRSIWLFNILKELNVAIGEDTVCAVMYSYIDRHEPQQAMRVKDEYLEAGGKHSQRLYRCMMRAHLEMGEYERVAALFKKSSNLQRPHLADDALLVRALLADDRTLNKGIAQFHSVMRRHSGAGRPHSPLGKNLMVALLAALERVSRDAALRELDVLMRDYGERLVADDETLSRAVNVCRKHADVEREEHFWLLKKQLAMDAHQKMMMRAASQRKH